MPELLHRILGYAATDPGRPCLSDPSTTLNYGQLAVEVDLFGSGLWSAGVRPGDRVALDIPNSVDFALSSLACLAIGAIFVPLPVSDPAARRRALVEDCDPKLIVVSDSLAGREPAEGRSTGDYPGRLTTTTGALRAAGGRDVPRATDPDRPAYCIYTSGTTGTPKGVLIGQQSFALAVCRAAALFGLSQESRGLCVSPFHFDGSFGTLYPVPAAGGSLVIPPREYLLAPRNFVRTVLEEQVTHTSFSPTYLRLLLSSRRVGDLRHSSLQSIALGGEACSMSDLRRLKELLPDIRLFNRYGPTEATIAVTTFAIPDEIIATSDSVPLGTPHEGVQFFLIEQKTGRLITTPGEVGQLYIGGDQLMQGYYGDPELSASVLRSDLVAGETLYETGDLVMRDPSGNYLYIDRADNVIKRNGVRISLTEIAQCLLGLEAVEDAACVSCGAPGETRLVAFVVTSSATGPPQLRRSLAAKLPASMVPDEIKILPSMPMTTAGKLDSRALARLAAQPSPEPPPNATRRGEA
jgi:D-alanine--poly(phosphoribitol) ligase subunit 1